jgi:uncharacterized lipoprotein YmbA
MSRWIQAAIALGFMSLPFAGCTSFSPRADPSRFFTLTLLAQVEEIAAKGGSDRARISLGIGPISFPGYLDRQEIVTRVTQNQIGVSENDRWAEPLDENFARVLAQNLSALLRAERINAYPWPIDEKPNYQVEIEVLRFEANAAGDVQLLARWTVRDTSKKNSIQHRESRISGPARTKSTEAFVAALSEALGEFSREIADAVRAIDGTRQPLVNETR